MPLELVTGPANAEKAGHVLDAVRRGVRAGREPLLVVPTLEDVRAYRDELAGEGVVFGLRVETFRGLEGEIARRGGVRGRAASDAVRRRVAAAAADRVALRELAGAAATPGFAPALVRLCDELAEHRVGPGRFLTALRSWAAVERGRAAFAEELGRLHGAYADGLRQLGAVDRATLAYAAHDAIRETPALWAGTPVVLYGFDDLDAVQLDAVETLVRAGAPVTVSLPFEPGREDVFRARAGTFARLDELADERVRLPAADPPSDPAARVLHHLERALLGAPGERPDPGDAVGFLSGGGERAELELVAAHVAAELRTGTAPEAIAVAVRDLRTSAPLVAEVFAEAGVPVALERQVALDRTALGRGLLALVRAALPGGTPEDLLAWLRTPGFLQHPELADRLEADVRTRGLRDAAAARARWEAEHRDFELRELDRVAAAAAAGVAPFCEELLAQAERLFTAPWRGTGAVLPAPAAIDARVLQRVRSLLGDLRDLAARAPALAGSPADAAAMLADERVWLGEPPGPGRVTVSDPLRLRARRVEALFLIRLQEGIFPAPARPEPFLGDPERRAVNAASGLRLGLLEDRLDAERYLLYATVSRPTRRLVLSWHAGDDDGQPRTRSLFVDDLLDHLAPDAGRAPLTRRLGELGPVPGAPPGPRRPAIEAALATAAAGREEGLGPLRDDAVLAELRARPAWSAGALEQWTGCPVRWFVERHLRPDALEPDPEAMTRGSLAHDVLQLTLERLGEAVSEANLPRARELARAALAERAPGARLPMTPRRREAVLRRLEVDVLRYLDFAAVCASGFTPSAFELSFGTSRDDRDPVDLGEGLRLSGRIDRVDRRGKAAIVIDYKGRSAQPPQASWLERGRVQAGLYALALPRLLGVEVVGALYQPIGAADQRPRGFVLADAPGVGEGFVATDRIDPERRDALLEGVLRAARRAADGIRAGRLAPLPETCSPQKRCAYPSICRCGDR